jgi:hypothetical protein
MSDHPWVEVGRGAELSPTGRPERLAGPEARLYGSEFMSAPTIDELEVADDPERWAALGFEVLDHGCQLGGVRVSLLGTKAGSGIVGWSLRDLESTDLDGLPTSVSERPQRESSSVQPNGVLSIDHIVAMSPAFQRSVEALKAAGLDLRRVRDAPTPAGAPRQAFFRLGREILELVQEPDEVVARAGGPDRPARFWGLALLVEDLDRAVEALAPHVGEIRDAVQPGRRIVTVRRSAGLALPLALMSREERAGADR